MKQIWEALWNNPVLVIGVVVLGSVTLLQEWQTAPDWLRIGLTVVIAVGGLLAARWSVSPTDTYREKVPADI